MNRRGDTTILMDTIKHLVIFIIFFSIMLWFILSYSNGSAFLEDFYAKELSLMINSAKTGQKFSVDVTKLASVAVKNGKPVRDMISIDNVNNKVTVSTRLNSGTSFVFFKDVDVVYRPVELPSGSSETSQFIFELKERRRI
jgi:uncharacterized membrane protein